MTIIVATADLARFRAALTLATAYAALGGSARVFCHEAAVALLAATPRADDGDHPTGAPDRLTLIAMAREAAVALIACQTGMAATGLAIDQLVAGVEPGGMIGVLGASPDDRIVGF